MERIRPQRRVQIDQSQQPKYDAVEEDENGMRLRQSNSNVTDDQEPFMGVKVRRKASLHRDYKGDYIDVASHPFLIKLLQKQGLLSMHSHICNACFPLFFIFLVLFRILMGWRLEITRFHATFECEFDSHSLNLVNQRWEILVGIGWWIDSFYTMIWYCQIQELYAWVESRSWWLNIFVLIKSIWEIWIQNTSMNCSIAFNCF